MFWHFFFNAKIKIENGAKAENWVSRQTFGNSIKLGISLITFQRFKRIPNRHLPLSMYEHILFILTSVWIQCVDLFFDKVVVKQLVITLFSLGDRGLFFLRYFHAALFLLYASPLLNNFLSKFYLLLFYSILLFIL